MRASDDVAADHLADLLGVAHSGIDGGLDRGDVATHDGGDVAATGLLVADQLDLGGLDHRVSGLDHGGEPLPNPVKKLMQAMSEQAASHASATQYTV